MKKQHIDKNGNLWEWEETPEIREFVRQQNAKKATVTLPLTTP
jgi:hypothetical protein